MSLEDRCRALVAALGLEGELRSVTPLSGGVASDIVMLDLGGRRICAKFALGKLKVAEDWHAPVHRNRAEYAWLRFAGSVVPGAVPHLYGWHDNGFAMAYLDGDDTALWKSTLLAGHPPGGEAAAVGDVLGRIHAASTAAGFDPAPFTNRDDFHALRLEPYLLFTAQRHPDLTAPLTALADALHERDTALIHGDVSPKNILFRGSDPVLLDAECATMGDPCFDVAFCLNHLVLKAFHLPALRADLFTAVGAFWRAYSTRCLWEEAAVLEARVCALLPALMLARVDGKSPVEYLSAITCDSVRQIARPLIAGPEATLPATIARLSSALKEGPPP